MVALEKKRLFSKIAFSLTLAAFVVIAGMYFYNIIKWSDYKDLGWGFRTATGIEYVGIVNEHGKQAGIQIGDRILIINGKSFRNIKEARQALNHKIGEKNTYLLEREGRPFEVTITNVPIGFKRSFGVSGLPFLMGLCYVLIGSLVFLMKPHTRNSWIFFLSTGTFGLWQFFIYKITIMRPLWLENMVIFAYCFTPAVIIHLALCFPKERLIIKRVPYIQTFPYILSIILFAGIRNSTQDVMDAPKFWLILAVAYIAIGIVVFLGSCVQLRLTSSSVIVKLRSRMILLGFAITASLPLVDYVINTVFHVYIVPSFNYYLPFFLFFPAFVGYSIVKHDLFDIDAIIKRTYGYVLTTGAIAGIYGLFVLVSNLAFGSYEFSKSPVFPLIFLLAIVFLFNPIRNRVQKIIDRVFYRLEYNYSESVKHISESMRTLLGLNEIGQSIMDTALGTMFIDSGSVMLRRKDESKYRCLIQAGEKDAAFTKTETLENDTSVADSEEKKAEQALTPVESSESQVVEKDTAKGTADKEDLNLADLTLAADEPLIRKMAEQKREVVIYDIQEDPFFEDQREACEKVFNQLDASLIVPLIYEDRLTGLISLGRKKSGKFYRKEDINLLNILANQGAVAIENAMMLEEVIEKERMEEELNIAQDLQVSMLPAACPQIEGFDFAAYSASAREVGGDFYDFIEIGEGKSGIVIGDVTGKSVSGALVMSASRSIFRMLGEEELAVSESMIRANRRTKKDIKSGMFVALLYAVLSAENKSLSLCSAGQTQPVYLSAATGEATLVETEGDTFPLGILDEAQYEETQLRLESGDRIILYTDGVVEAMNEKEELFGFDRLLEVVKNSQATTAETLLEEIKGKVNEFADGAAQHDDITIIVIQAT
jgi:serine phosphatase RsbU (regulator of sigma subunit)